MIVNDGELALAQHGLVVLADRHDGEVGVGPPHLLLDGG